MTSPSTVLQKRKHETAARGGDQYSAHDSSGREMDWNKVGLILSLALEFRLPRLLRVTFSHLIFNYH